MEALTAWQQEHRDETAEQGESAAGWPRKILLACDGSEQSTRAARLVAGMVGPEAVIRVITVASFEFAPFVGEWGPLGDAAEGRTQLALTLEHAFRKPLELLETAGCRVEQTNRLGHPGREILNEAAEWEPDLLVVGRTGAGGVSRLFLGSVSELLVKNAKVPVLVVS